MDDEIMDFQWFEHVTWDSIRDPCLLVREFSPISGACHVKWLFDSF